MLARQRPGPNPVGDLLGRLPGQRHVTPNHVPASPPRLFPNGWQLPRTCRRHDRATLRRAARADRQTWGPECDWAGALRSILPIRASDVSHPTCCALVSQCTRCAQVPFGPFWPHGHRTPETGCAERRMRGPIECISSDVPGAQARARALRDQQPVVPFGRPRGEKPGAGRRWGAPVGDARRPCRRGSSQ
jgi:hypothetical protein